MTSGTPSTTRAMAKWKLLEPMSTAAMVLGTWLKRVSMPVVLAKHAGRRKDPLETHGGPWLDLGCAGCCDLQHIANSVDTNQ